MSDNQKFIIIAIVICTILAFLVSIQQRNIDNEVNYDYYVVTDSGENDPNLVEGYKISSNISSKITDNHIRLGLSAILDYNLNIQSTEIYPGDIFDKYDTSSLPNDYIITTALNTLYKSDILIQTTKTEKESTGFDYKITSLSVDRVIKFLFGNINYDKKIATSEIFYKEDTDIYYYKENPSEEKKNHIEVNITEINENSNILEVEVAIAYINYQDKKVYADRNGSIIISDSINEKELFNKEELYPRYKLEFTKNENNIYIFQSIAKIDSIE
ncbi:MAG: hypothetical protein ACI31M_01135 [Bacilli bacterium]